MAATHNSSVGWIAHLNMMHTKTRSTTLPHSGKDRRPSTGHIRRSKKLSAAILSTDHSHCWMLLTVHRPLQPVLIRRYSLSVPANSVRTPSNCSRFWTRGATCILSAPDVRLAGWPTITALTCRWTLIAVWILGVMGIIQLKTWLLRLPGRLTQRVDPSKFCGNWPMNPPRQSHRHHCPTWCVVMHRRSASISTNLLDSV
ncbi:hypothetical protein SAMN05216388_10432 [Halorientalis persicus]|uniref:Uncharacterized protein n=1 Tax=Halorientalis persicus TaxID=1367881 RepID=A0A1H8VVV6_9EURY|nr:hypothetical protein SAMN05216388_10432 [Halorientalis persicus]